jgi:uncharacterized membrane protein YedE/YeeE
MNLSVTRALISASVGFLFGMGLLISGMNNPAKVRGFLDFFGQWQPALIAVMGSAVVLFGLGYRLSRIMKGPLLGDRFHEPVMNRIDRRLLIGASLFGVGWGMVGLCPGPALVNLASLDWRIIGFVAMVALGNRLAHWLVGPAIQGDENKAG